MRLFSAVVLGFCVAVAAKASPDSDQAEPAQAQDAELPSVGDSYDQVIARMGKPSSVMEVGTIRILVYPTAKVKVRDGQVALVTPIAARVAPTPTPAAVTAEGFPAMVLVSDDVEKQIWRFSNAVAARFEAEKFAELDELADKVVANKAKFADGTWRISRFDAHLYLKASEPDEKWQALEAKIGRWETARPDSIEARVIHVNFLTDYAWKARGTDWAGKVDPNAWAVFSNRLAQAYIVYQGAQGMAKKSPVLWEAASRIALGQQWEVEDMLKHYEEARAAEPLFPGYEGNVAYFLLPRWYGKPGDWEQFALQESLRPDGRGAEGYATTCVGMIEFYPDHFFKNTTIEWPRLKEGFNILVQKYPKAKWWLNQYARFAVMASDREAARAAFEAMNGQADANLWSKDEIHDFQKWTYWHP
jgi:hypothetical protein